MAAAAVVYSKAYPSELYCITIATWDKVVDLVFSSRKVKKKKEEKNNNNKKHTHIHRHLKILYYVRFTRDTHIPPRWSLCDDRVTWYRGRSSEECTGNHIIIFSRIIYRYTYNLYTHVRSPFERAQTFKVQKRKGKKKNLLNFYRQRLAALRRRYIETYYNLIWY